MSLLFGLAFIAIGAGIYTVIQARKAKPAANAVQFEKPAVQGSAASASPLLKHLEITGLRLTEDNKRKAQIQFVIVNHSGAEIGELAANVNLKAVAGTAEQEPVGTFSFKVPSLGPYESKEIKADVDTKLRVYELPDWQFLRADVQITSPR